MAFFQDTTFGAIFRILSGGRLFYFQDDRDEELREKYLSTQKKKFTEKDDSDSSSELEKSNKEYMLIDFLPNDPAEPRNWSLFKKCFVTFDVCLLTFSIYIGSAIYTAGIETLVTQFEVSQTAIIVGLTLYVIGYGIGPMVWAPLSEVPYFGRNPIYLGTLFCFVFLNFGVVYAKNIGMLLAFRFLTGFFGSPVLATGGATISDMYAPNKRPYPLAIYGIANICGPVVGPLIGGFAAQFEGWTWTIWEIIWLSGFCFVFLFFFFPETSAANILYRRTSRLRKYRDEGAVPLKCQPEVEAEKMSAKDAAMMTFVYPFQLSLLEPICLALNMYIALIYALLYCWLESIPLAFEGVYGFSLGITGLCYLGILIGALLVLAPYFWYNYKYVEPRFNDKMELRPEIRLEPALVGCFCIPICLFWFGWTARESVHYIVPIIGTGFFSIGAFLMFSAVLNYLGDAYPAYIASVFAGNDLFRSTFGAAFPLFANQMFTTLGLDWGNSLLGFISILFIPIPFILIWKGKSIRMRSKTARHDL